MTGRGSPAAARLARHDGQFTGPVSIRVDIPDSHAAAVLDPRLVRVGGLLRPGRLPHIPLDFFGEESVHADAVGDLEGFAHGIKRLASITGLWVVGAPHRCGAKMEDHPMPSKNVKLTESPKANRTASRQSLRSARKTGQSLRSKRVTGATVERRPRKNSKQQICLSLLSRPKGATIEELQKATGWKQHSVRGFLAGTVKKKLGLTLLSEKLDAGSRRYRVPATV